MRPNAIVRSGAAAAAAEDNRRAIQCNFYALTWPIGEEQARPKSPVTAWLQNVLVNPNSINPIPTLASLG